MCAGFQLILLGLTTLSVQSFQHRKKNDGGVRGMVVGDGWWPAIAQQFTQEGGGDDEHGQ